MYMYDTESHKDYNDISNANGNDDAIMIIMIMIIMIKIMIISIMIIVKIILIIMMIVMKNMLY